MRGRKLPLAGVQVVVTRPEGESGELQALLTQSGADVLAWPTVEVSPPADSEPLDAALRRLPEYGWIAFTSARAVRAVRERVEALPQTVRVACVGNRTANAVRAAGWRCDRTATPPGAAGLVRTFAEAGDARGTRILFPASSLAADTLHVGLEQLGATVDTVQAYTVRTANLDGDRCVAELSPRRQTILTFTSPSAVRGLVHSLGGDGFHELCRQAAAAVIGPTTAAALRKEGVEPSCCAQPNTLAGLAGAIEQMVHERSP